MDNEDLVERLISLWIERAWGMLLCGLVMIIQEDRAWVIISSQFIVFFCYQSLIARLKPKFVIKSKAKWAEAQYVQEEGQES